MGATPPPAHLPERRACSCQGPKKAHRNLVGLRRTASRSPRSVLSARASSRSFITAIGVGRRDFTVWTGRQRALVAPGRPCPAPYAGWSPSLPKRIGRTEVRSPRPFRALVALAGRNLPPLCSPPRRRAGLSAMAQIERAYATYPTTLVVPLASTHATRCSQHRPPFALVRLLLLWCCCAWRLIPQSPSSGPPIRDSQLLTSPECAASQLHLNRALLTPRSIQWY